MTTFFLPCMIIILMRNLPLLFVFIMALLFFVPKTNRQQDMPPLKSQLKESEEGSNIPKINSMSCVDVGISMKGRMPLAIHGSIFLDGKKFRMTASSFFGKELDIGVNDQVLWYWSKRSKPRVMYFSKLENIKKTKLKSALSPEWIIMSLMIDNSQVKPDEKIEHPSGTILLNKHTSHMDESMTVATLLDRNGVQPKGRYLYNSHGKMVASSEVTSRQVVQGFSMPKALLITWYEEGIVMEWTLKSVSLNTKISNGAWAKPDIKPMVDIGR